MKSYLEVLAERDGARRAGARRGRLPRLVHARARRGRSGGTAAAARRRGVAVAEPEQSGRLTWCCGGPAEALHPEQALEQARRRVEQLRAAGGVCVTACPICLVNLEKAADGSVSFRDFSEVLLEARERELQPASR